MSDEKSNGDAACSMRVEIDAIQTQIKPNWIRFKMGSNLLTILWSPGDGTPEQDAEALLGFVDFLEKICAPKNRAETPKPHGGNND